MVVSERIRIAIIALIMCLIGAVASAEEYKNYTLDNVPNVRLSNKYNHVTNPDGIISTSDAARINSALNALEDTLGIEVAVVAIEGIGDSDAREFATDLFNKWKIGEKSKDNGLLIQLVTEPSQRSIVFETGYGIEGVLPDAICYRIQQRYMIPYLKEGNYSEGMLAGVEAVSQYLLASDYERKSIIGSDDDDFESEDIILLIVVVATFGCILLYMLVQYLNHRPKVCPRCGQKTLIYCGNRTIVAATRKREGLEEEIWRCRNCGHTQNKKRKISRISEASAPIIIGGSGGSWGGGFGGGSWGGGSSGGGGSISRF